MDNLADEEKSLQSLYLNFCSASKVLTDDERPVLAKLAHALSCVLCEKARGLIRRSAVQPVLISYQSDATSHLCKAITVAVGGSHVIRHGKVLVELLIERGFVKARSPTGKEEVAFLLCAPRPLSNGEACWNGFSAAADFFQ